MASLFDLFHTVPETTISTSQPLISDSINKHFYFGSQEDQNLLEKFALLSLSI